METHTDTHSWYLQTIPNWKDPHSERAPNGPLTVPLLWQPYAWADGMQGQEVTLSSPVSSHLPFSLSSFLLYTLLSISNLFSLHLFSPPLTSSPSPLSPFPLTSSPLLLPLLPYLFSPFLPFLFFPSLFLVSSPILFSPLSLSPSPLPISLGFMAVQQGI